MLFRSMDRALKPIEFRNFGEYYTYMMKKMYRQLPTIFEDDVVIYLIWVKSMEYGWILKLGFSNNVGLRIGQHVNDHSRDKFASHKIAQTEDSYSFAVCAIIQFDGDVKTIEQEIHAMLKEHRNSDMIGKREYYNGKDKKVVDKIHKILEEKTKKYKGESLFDNPKHKYYESVADLPFTFAV